MTLQEFIDAFEKVSILTQQGLETADTLAKSYGATNISLPIEGIELLLPIVEQLVGNGLMAWQKASGTAITIESVTALLPDSTPLDPPTQ